MKGERVRVVSVSAEFLVGKLGILRVGTRASVPTDKWPADAELVAMRVRHREQVIELWIRSESFDVAPWPEVPDWPLAFHAIEPMPEAPPPSYEICDQRRRFEIDGPAPGPVRGEPLYTLKLWNAPKEDLAAPWGHCATFGGLTLSGASCGGTLWMVGHDAANALHAAERAR